MDIRIRLYRPDDSDTLAEIFTAAIHHAAPDYYTAEEIHAWAPPEIDYSEWEQKLGERPPFVAVLDKQIVGFMTLAEDGYVDRTYIHPDHQRKGIAGKLYAHIERTAGIKGLNKLYVDASHMAKPFFASMGFKVVRLNTICKGVVSLDNWRMEKYLDQATQLR